MDIGPRCQIFAGATSGSAPGPQVHARHPVRRADRRDDGGPRVRDHSPGDVGRRLDQRRRRRLPDVELSRCPRLPGRRSRRAHRVHGLTGWVEVGDRAVISGLAGIHQFVRIGTLAFVSGSVPDPRTYRRTSRRGQSRPRPRRQRGGVAPRRRAGRRRRELKRAYRIDLPLRLGRDEALAQVRGTSSGVRSPSSAAGEFVDTPSVASAGPGAPGGRGVGGGRPGGLKSGCGRE